MKNLQKILFLVVSLASGFLISAESELCPEVAVTEVVCAEPECIVEEYVVEVEAPKPTLTVVLPGNRVVVCNPLLCDVPVEVASVFADILAHQLTAVVTALSLSHADLTNFAANMATLVKHRGLQATEMLSVESDGVKKHFYPVVLSAEAKDAIERARLGIREFASKLIVDDVVFESLTTDEGGLFKVLANEFAEFLLALSGDDDAQAVAALRNFNDRICNAVQNRPEDERLVFLSYMNILKAQLVKVYRSNNRVEAFVEQEAKSVDTYHLYSKKVTVFVDRPALSGTCEVIYVPATKEVYTNLAVERDDSLTCDQGINMSFVRDSEGKATLLIVGSDVVVKPGTSFTPTAEEIVVSDSDGFRYEMAIPRAENVTVFNT